MRHLSRAIALALLCLCLAACQSGPGNLPTDITTVMNPELGVVGPDEPEQLSIDGEEDPSEAIKSEEGQGSTIGDRSSKQERSATPVESSFNEWLSVRPEEPEQELEYVIAQLVCERDDIWTKDASDIIDILDAEYEKLSQDGYAHSPHQTALMLDGIRECFREQTDVLISGDSSLIDQVDSLRSTNLALNEAYYNYIDNVEGGGSLYVAVANSFPGMLEIYLYHYVQERADVASSTDDTMRFEQSVNAVQDRIKKMNDEAQHDEYATQLVDQFEASLNQFLDLLKAQTVADANLLEKISRRFIG